MILRSQIKTYTDKEPKFDDIMLSLISTGKQPKGIIAETREVVAIARKFNDQVVRPYAWELDRKMHQDPEYLPWDFVSKANEMGFYTMFIPKIFGGKGYNLACAGAFLEEVGSVCLSLANLIGVHYLGYTMLTASWNIKILNRMARQVLAGEKSGQPCLLTLAITEPDAGTDSQNIELMDSGQLGCHAQKVEGGYVINGTKIFISGGHMGTWHIVHAYTDLKKGSETTVMFAVKTGTKGFSFGRKEKKMGQKASVASELIFKNVFIPDQDVCIDNRDASKLKRSLAKTNEQILAYIWGASRMGVGCFGTAAARGAFEITLEFASKTQVNGQLLINQQWCQCMLAEMYKNVATSRTTCAEANYASGLYGLWKSLNLKPLYYFMKYTPQRILDIIFNRVSEQSLTTWLFRKICFDNQTDAQIDCVDGWGSLAKFACTDAAVKNCEMALEIMGQAGLRHDRRIEKICRDVKLLQIYEGTNEINRINLFKRMISRCYDQADCFCDLNCQDA